MLKKRFRRKLRLSASKTSRLRVFLALQGEGGVVRKPFIGWVKSGMLSDHSA
jgi:hypothetical protein